MGRNCGTVEQPTFRGVELSENFRKGAKSAFIIVEEKENVFFYRIGQSFKNERLIDSFRQCSMELLLHLHSVKVLIVETVVKKAYIRSFENIL